jgi:hypothetical protein
MTSIMLHASFITVDEDPDLIVSFGIEPSGTRSLTLIRSPHLEHLIPDEDRGVTVSYSGDTSGVSRLLLSVDWADEAARFEVTNQIYALDVSRVEAVEIAEAKRILSLMKADGRFRCDVV